MLRPPYLRRGDLVAIASPARKVSHEELLPAIRLFESWGLRVALPDHLFDSHHQWAGTDQTRAALMQRLLDDPEVKAIICARGGYGTVRIIDQLDFSAFIQHPKWIVGYSDITVLHSHIYRHCGIETLHAVMPVNITTETAGQPAPAIATLRQALFGGEADCRFDCHPLNRAGVGEGPLVGGNLSILYSLCGSPSAIDTRGKILFIEDLDEYLYHIDRMMQNLKRNGSLAQLAGLVVGRFSDMHDNAVPFGMGAEEIIKACVEEYAYPVAFGFPAGHIGIENRALFLGRKASLETSRTACSLRFF